MKKPKKPTDKFQNLKGKGLETKSNEMYTPEPIETSKTKFKAPAAKRIEKRTEKKVGRITDRLDKATSRVSSRVKKLAAKSEVASARGNEKKASVLSARSKMKEVKAGEIQKRKSARVANVKNAGATAAKTAQKNFEDKATLKAARKSGKFTPKTLELRRANRAGVAEKAYAATLGAAMAATGVAHAVKAVKKKK